MNRPRPPALQIRLFIAILGYGVALALGYGLLATNLRSGVAVQWLALSLTVAVYELGVCWRALSKHQGSDCRERSVLGVANGLTLLRGTFCALAAGFLLLPRPSGWIGWLPAVLCALCGLLDYADGAVARGVGQETALGARLDITFDAMLTLVATALCVRYGQVPLAYLGVGFARYVFVSGIWLRRWLDKPVHDLPESRVRRYLYIVQLCFAVGVLTPLFNPPITSYGALCILAVFLSGFVRDWFFITGRFGTPSRIESVVVNMDKSLRTNSHPMKEINFIHDWLPVGLRVLTIVIVVPPAVSKFFVYGTQVAQFEIWGVPVPAVSVLVAGAIELLAVIAFVLGAAGRFAALGLASVMIVAMLTAEVNPLNALVLLSAIGIIILGTGRFSVWMPERTLLTERK